eukprot:TRINITY_DN9756_c0_g5_i1.p1 TRINITY_DN9756_c0_g5~~TRINITY_DN9756_c0_g5_i1.p1  ORF type:complete len:534 (-),score=124.75 TRINITY_DN9756_c0_g5_i1:55-1656(-)
MGNHCLKPNAGHESPKGKIAAGQLRRGTSRHYLPTLLGEAVKRVEGKVGTEATASRFHQRRKLTDRYIVQPRILGEGFNGNVYMATCRFTGERRAVKSFELPSGDYEKILEAAGELEIFMSLDHPHVARLYDVYEEEGSVALVMEFLEGGELYSRLQLERKFPEAEAAKLIRQMLLAVAYLHHEGVVHCDLKLENFLFEQHGSDFLKMIDFGFSRVLQGDTAKDGIGGTPAYIAPEVLQGVFDNRCDLWSIGVIAFALLSGSMPFNGGSAGAILRSVKKGAYTMREERWHSVSSDARDFVKSLLVKDRFKRLSAAEALRHPWLDGSARAAARAAAEEGASRSLDRGVVARALCTFAQERPLRRRCLQMMAWSLSRAERAALRGAFLELDRKEVGVLTLEDTRRLLVEALDLRGEELEATLHVFEQMDVDGDGEIHYSDFLAAMAGAQLLSNPGICEELFRRFDVAGDGFIEAEDMVDVLGRDLNPEDVVHEVSCWRSGTSSGLSKSGRFDKDMFITYLQGGCTSGADELIVLA